MSNKNKSKKAKSKRLARKRALSTPITEESAKRDSIYAAKRNWGTGESK